MRRLHAGREAAAGYRRDEHLRDFAKLVGSYFLQWLPRSLAPMAW
jgi:hypothetical protein